MASPLRPQFFCTRPNGSVTPLIAVDELPTHISIRGVSRALSANDTQGMTSLGTVNGRNQFYVVDGVPTAPMRGAAAAAGNSGASAAAATGGPVGGGGRSRDHDLRGSLLRILSDETIPASQRLALHASIQQALAPSWAASGNASSSPSASGWLVPAASSGGASTSGPTYNTKKEFCSYWIRHGECDYQQQGCLYKHEMPTDPSMLEKLGLRDIPRWYREKYGVPSLLPGASQSARGQSWKGDAADYAVKSIQYQSRLRYNGSPASSSDTDRPSKQKTLPTVQHSNVAVYPAGPRSTHDAVNSPRSSGSHRNGPKSMGNNRIDLLSPDPMQDYASFNSLHGMGYPASGSGNHSNNNKASDAAHHEGMVRNLQSLMPGTTDYLTGPLDTNLPPQRSKKPSKPRRLYQPRSQIVLPGDGQQSHHGNTHSSAASAASKGTNGSQVASPVNVLGSSGLSSDPPTRVASPSLHSHTSLSSQSSPRAYGNKGREKGPKLLPGAIGSKQGYRKRSTNSSEEDLFDLGLEPGNEHGK